MVGLAECPVPEMGTRHATITGATPGVPTPVGAVVGQACTPPGVPVAGTGAPRTCFACGSFSEVATRCIGTSLKPGSLFLQMCETQCPLPCRHRLVQACVT